MAKPIGRLPHTRFELVTDRLCYLTLGGLFFFILGWLGYMSLLRGQSPRWFHHILPAVPALVATYWFALALCWFAKRRGRAEAETHDFKLCTRCRYPLDALLEQGECPECGTSCEIDRVRWQWQQRYFGFQDWRAAARK